MTQTVPQPLRPKQTINRLRRPGLDLTEIGRQGIREFQLTIRPLPSERPAALFRRLAETLSEAGAVVVRQEVFGDLAERAAGLARMRRLFGAVDWPITWIEGKSCGKQKIAGMHVLAVTGAEVSTLHLDGQTVGRVYSDGWARHFLIGEVLPAGLSASKPAQTTEAFTRLESLLRHAGLGMQNLVRTWCYLDDILSWYEPFNYARTGFYLDRQVLRRLMPASTGVSGRNTNGAAISLSAWAIQPLNGSLRITDVTSPMQCSAASYGSSFSRAVELATPGLRRLLVSGTASIEPGGKSVHLGDLQAQIELSMKVVGGILRSCGMTFSDVTRATAYLKHRADAPAFAEWCAENGMNFLPTVTLQADICREELLFEIEVDALSQSR